MLRFIKVLYFIGYVTQYISDRETRIAHYKAMQYTIAPTSCKPPAELTYFEWINQPSDEVRDEQCIHYITELLSYNTWPNPFLIFIQYNFTIFFTPLQVAVELITSLYFKMVVTLGSHLATFLLIVLVVALSYTVSRCTKIKNSIYKQINQSYQYNNNPLIEEPLDLDSIVLYTHRDEKTKNISSNQRRVDCITEVHDDKRNTLQSYVINHNSSSNSSSNKYN